MMKKISTTIIFSFFLIICQALGVLAWTVAPVRFEIKGEKGKEYTFTFSVLNESQLYQKRFEIRTDDWILDKNNNFLRKSFNSEINNKYPATSWIKVTPQQFVVPPGETKNIRFTVTVPKALPSEGEYTTGIFVGEKNIEKPPKGEKIVHIKQDTFIGVIVYVRTGEEKKEVILKDLRVKTKTEKNGLSKVTLLPVFENKGNVHSRGQVSVKLEPITNAAIEETKKEINAGEVVILRESEVTFPIDIPTPLTQNSSWKFVVSADFGKSLPVLVGTKKYKILQAEVQDSKQEANNIKQGTTSKEVKN